MVTTEEKLYKPFRVGRVWKQWDPVQKRLRVLQGVHMVEAAKKSGSKKKDKGKKRKHHQVKGQAGKKKKEKERLKEAPADYVPTQVTFPGGNTAEIGPDGGLWHRPEAYGGQVCVKMRKADFLQQLTGHKDGYVARPQFLRVPDTSWKVGVEQIREWTMKLARYDTEALCIYGKLRGEPTEDSPLWLAVVPKQECGAAFVDVDDYGPALEVLSRRGYFRVGTIHTHPGGGGGTPCCSGTDLKDLWREFGGVHLIVNKGGGVAVYFSMGGETWEIGRETGWTMPRLWENIPKVQEGCYTLLSETGTNRIGRMIKKKFSAIQRAGTTYDYGKQQGSKNYGYGVQKRRMYLIEGAWWTWNPATQKLRPALPFEIAAERAKKVSEEVVDAIEEGRNISKQTYFSEKVKKTEKAGETKKKKQDTPSSIFPTGEDITNDASIIEAVRILEGWKWSLNEEGESLRKRLTWAVGELERAFRAFGGVIGRMDDEGECHKGVLREAMESVKNNLYLMEMDLRGPDDIQTVTSIE